MHGRKTQKNSTYCSVIVEGIVVSKLHKKFTKFSAIFIDLKY